MLAVLLYKAGNRNEVATFTACTLTIEVPARESLPRPLASACADNVPLPVEVFPSATASAPSGTGSTSTAPWRTLHHRHHHRS